MALVNKFNVNKQQVTLDADIIENMSANDVSYNNSTQYDENTVGDKLSELGQQVIYDVTANNNRATFASLSELLSSENLSNLIPVSVRCGGMSIRFVQSSNNKYVQFRLMTTSFSTDEYNWQGVDDEPTAGSKNLVESDGVSKCFNVFTVGSYVNNSGLESVNSNYAITPFIKIIPGREYYVKLYQGPSVSALCLYDKDYKFISQYYADKYAAFTETLVIDNLLADYPKATFMRMSGNISYGYFINTIRLNEVDIYNSIFKSEKNTKLFFKSGYIKRTDGKEYSHTEYVHTDYIPVLTKGKYRISAYDSGDSSTLKISAIQIYDANKNNLGAFYQYTGTSIIIDMSFTTEDIQTIYPTAKYMIITGSVNYDYYIVGIDAAEAFKHSDDAKKELENVDAQINNKIGEDTKTDTYTSDNYSNISYNATRQEFVVSGPSTNGIIVPLKAGIKYKCAGPISIRICTEIPSVGKTSSIISRNIAVGEEFTCQNGEVCVHLGLSQSTFTSALVTVYSYGLSRRIEKNTNDIASIANNNDIYYDAVEFDTINNYRERQLRQEYWDKVNNEQYVGKWYGVQWTEIDNPDNVVAINSTGDNSLHTTLPIQNKMRRCVTKDNIVQYYLDINNSELKADGTAANLDGTDGNVMVEIPEFFYKVEEETVSDVRTIRIKISEDALPDFIFSPKRYTSAYEATINRETGFLSSVCTTLFTRNASENVMTNSDSYIQGTSLNRGTNRTARRNGHTENAATYRGGTNDATLDQYEDASQQNYSRNQLGLPVANVNIQDIRKACAEDQFGYLYDTQRILYMLIQTEFKTRDIQKPFSQGGLGLGATVYPDYQSYEKFFSPQGGISCIPCGVTNSLGNASGEVYYLMENVPVSHTGSGGEMVMTYGNVWMPCMSYRGIEHYYGHIYKVADQVVCVTGPTTGYVDEHDGDVYWSKHDVSWWYEKNPYLAKINIKIDKNFLGTWNFACHIMTVSSLLMGKYGHVLHIGTKDKERQKNYCDCCEIDAKANSNKYITFNGRIVSTSLVGNHFIVSHNTIDGGDARPSDGTRLDHF